MDKLSWIQHLGPKSNCTEEAIAYGRCDGAPIIGYVSDARVFVLSGEFRILQILTPPEGVEGLEDVARALAISSSDGKIAVSYGRKVGIFTMVYQLDPNGQQRSTWKFSTILEHSSPVNSISWHPAGSKLLTASRSISLWKASNNFWSLAWSTSSSTEVFKIRFSPDGRLFASLGKSDRLLKIWYKTERELADLFGEAHQFQFLYISHPRAVLSFSWRTPKSLNESFNKNVLLTTCLDRVCRIWSETSFEESIGFYACCFVEPIQSAITSESSFYIPGAINWLDSYELQIALNPHSLVQTENTLLNLNRMRTNSSHMPYSLRSNPYLSSFNDLKNTKNSSLKDYPEILQNGTDLIVKIQHDGTLIIWGIQYLCEEPRRVPHVFTVLRITNAIPVDPRFLKESFPVFCAHRTNYDETLYPPYLTFLCQTSDGGLNGLAINLRETFVNLREANELTLRAFFTGPKGVAKELFMHHNPNFPFFASLSSRGEVDIWKKDPNQFLNCGLLSLVRPVSSLPLVKNRPYTHFAWIPSSERFVTYNGTEIEIYSIFATHLELRTFDSNAILKIGSLQLPQPNLFEFMLVLEDVDPISFLDLKEEGVVKEPQAQEKCPLILGIPKNSSDAQIWRLTEIDQNQVTLEPVLVNFQPPFPEGLPKIVSALSDDCRIDLPSFPFYLFSTVHEDGTLRFWHFRSFSSKYAAKDPNEPFWSEISSLSLSSKPTTVRAAPFSFFGVASGSLLSIYEMPFDAGLPFSHESDVLLSEPILSFDWMVTYDGHLILAILSKSGIKLFTQTRASGVEKDDTRWQEVASIPGEFLNIRWCGRDGTLLASQKDTILVFTKWIYAVNTLASSTLQPLNSEKKHYVWNLLEASSLVNQPLPDYDPRSLKEYLLWGKFTQVQKILAHLKEIVSSLKDSELKEMGHLPPFPLAELLEEQAVAGGEQAANDAQYQDLFQTPSLDDENAPVSAVSKEQMVLDFLNEKLTSISLPGIHKKDQVLLLAVIDTLKQLESQKRALDDNAVRYLLALRVFFFLSHSLPLPQRPKALDYHDIIWALHSESQEILLDKCVSGIGTQIPLTWTHLRAMGVGLWLKNNEVLKKTIETIARNIYMSHEDKDPVSCAMFYLALNKKNVWHGLWKMAKSHPEHIKMTGFLQNNFNEPRWKQAALKNAFALLGLQRFEYAAAFFLLGGSLKDAVNVCIKNLKDIQLAIVLCRINEGESGPVLRYVLNEVLLPSASQESNRWLASIAFYHLGLKEKALRVIIEPMENLVEKQGGSRLGSTDASPEIPQSSKAENLDTSLLVFFEWYKKAPIFKTLLPSLWKYEARFLVQISRAYEKSGHLALSLTVLRLWKGALTSRLNEKIKETIEAKSAPKATAPKKDTAAALFDDDPDGHKLSTGTFSSDFDWGTPMAKPDLGFGFGGDDDFDTSSGFTLSLFQAPPKPVAPVVVEEEASTSSSGSRSAFDEALEEVFPEFIQKYSLLSELTNLTSMRLMHTIRRTLSPEADKIRANEAITTDHMTTNFLSWLKALSDASELTQDKLKTLLIGSCASLEKFRPYCELLSPEVPMSEPNTAVFEAILTKARTLSTLLFSFKLGTLDMALINEEADLHFHSFLWSSSRELCSCALRWKEDIQKIAEKNPFYHQWRLLEVAWTVALVNSLCALEERRFLPLCDWMRQLSSMLVTYARKKEIVSLTTKMLEESEKLIQPSEDELVFVTMDDNGNEDRESGSSDDESGPIKIKIKHQEETNDQNATRKKLSTNLIQLSLVRMFLALLDASINCFDQKVEEGSSNAIALGIFSGLVKLANALEEKSLHLFQTFLSFKQGSTINSVLRSSAEKTLWSALQEIHTDLSQALRTFFSSIGSMQQGMIEDLHSGPGSGHESPSKPGSPAAQISASANLPTLDPLVSARKVTTLNPDDNPTEWVFLPKQGQGNKKRIQSLPNFNQLTSKEMDTRPQTICQVNDMILSFCINKINHEYAAISSGKRVWEFDIEKTFFPPPQFEDPTSQLEGRDEEDPPNNGSSESLNFAPSHRRTNSEFAGGGTQKLHETMKSSENIHKSQPDKILDFNSLSIVRPIACQALESHPTLPFYLCGDEEGRMSLFQFKQPPLLATFRLRETARIQQIRFNDSGTKIAAVDSKGSLELWNFEVNMDTPSYQRILTHSKNATDVLFLSSGSLLATAGQSNSKKNVSLWDTLMPPTKSRIKGFQVHDGGASSLAFSPRNHTLISGGRKGEINLYDIRQCRVMDTFQAHTKNVKALYIDEERNFLYSGSADGDIKVWNLQTLECLDVLKNFHQKNTFLRASLDRSPVAIYGVMKIDSTSNWLFSCGADGSVKRRPHPQFFIQP